MVNCHQILVMKILTLLSRCLSSLWPKESGELSPTIQRLSQYANLRKVWNLWRLIILFSRLAYWNKTFAKSRCWSWKAESRVIILGLMTKPYPIISQWWEKILIKDTNQSRLSIKRSLENQLNLNSSMLHVILILASSRSRISISTLINLIKQKTCKFKDRFMIKTPTKRQ